MGVSDQTCCTLVSVSTHGLKDETDADSATLVASTSQQRIGSLLDEVIVEEDEEEEEEDEDEVAGHEQDPIQSPVDIVVDHYHTPVHRSQVTTSETRRTSVGSGRLSPTQVIFAVSIS